VRLDHEVDSVDIADVGDIELARTSRVDLTSAGPVAGENIIWSWHQRFGPNIIRVDTAGSEEGYSAYLTSGGASDPIAVAGASKRSFGAVFWNYLVLGYTHILPKGLDHILFVVGLFLLSTRLRPLLLQITSFTVAHTVTLALGVTGVVQLPAGIVEPLIAASIVYVCVENILTDKLQRWRTAVVFGFGLLHGLGFAGVLAEIGISSASFVTALVAFNVGVELGQVTVIAGCFLLVGLWFHDQPWYRSRVTIPASAVIAVIGAYWFVERIVWS
jgi:hydrogenase/urease accessory protein HupE